MRLPPADVSGKSTRTIFGVARVEQDADHYAPLHLRRMSERLDPSVPAVTDDRS